MDRFLSNLTTGDCAAAAARAAAASLIFKIDYDYVTISHGGSSRTISVYKDEQNCNNLQCEYHALMEGGAAPDIRERAEIHVVVSYIRDLCSIDEKSHIDVRYGNLFLKGGEGIGTAAAGNDRFHAGEALIEKDARKLIFDAVADVCEMSDGAQLLMITVSSPEGMMIAARQTAGQTVFTGGISIMGEYGTIPKVHMRDISDSISGQIERQTKLGVRSLLVCPGDYCADKISQSLHVDLKTAVKCYNFPGQAIDTAVEKGVENMLLVGNVGKLVKLAAGIMNTNSTASDARREIFAAHTALSGGSLAQVRTIMGCITVDEILFLLNSWGLRDRVMGSIMTEVHESVKRRSQGRLRFGVAFFSETFGLLGQTIDTKNVLVKVSQEQYALSLKLK